MIHAIVHSHILGDVGENDKYSYALKNLFTLVEKPIFYLQSEKPKKLPKISFFVFSFEILSLKLLIKF